MQPHNQQKRDHQPRAPKEFEEKVIEIKRVTQKKKGGNKISFSALVVIGDRKGRAAVGFNKAPDVMSAIQKSIGRAKKRIVTIQRVGADSIPHEILFKYKSASILLKPAPEGTGVIAGGPIRSVIEAFGIRNLVSKMMGSSNKTLNVYATFMALEAMRKPEAINPELVKKEIEVKNIVEIKNVTVAPEAKKETVIKKEIAKNDKTTIEDKPIAKKAVKTVKKAVKKSAK